MVSMKKFSLSGFLMLMSFTAFTNAAWAIPAKKIHVIDNLTTQEENVVKKIIEKSGYQLSKSPVFSESTHTIVITKNNGDDREPATIQVELLKKDESQVVPKPIFNLKLETKDVSEVLEKIPTAQNLYIMPVALQN